MIRGGVREKAVFYINCDSVLDAGELLKTMRMYYEHTDSLRIDKKYVFIDEISGIQNWQKTIKILVDTGEMKNTCLFLTGSHTLDMKKGPGAFDGNKIHPLLLTVGRRASEPGRLGETRGQRTRNRGTTYLTHVKYILLKSI